MIPAGQLRSRLQASLLGAAVGDALGWPHERRGRRVAREAENTSSTEFMDWTRTRGSRFASLQEQVRRGEYSDDTQLIIAVGRSRLLGGHQWLSWLQQVELPFFLAYERGAGASVKRACRVWLSGRPPWLGKRADAEAYFAAGANGAAMRAVPHVLYHLQTGDFRLMLRDVTLDGASTHGHPRALLGAKLHAAALWFALQQHTPITYGALLDELLDRIVEWTTSDWQELGAEWIDASRRLAAKSGAYSDTWDQTVRECRSMLEEARTHLGKGSIASAAGFLESIGVTSRATNGSGTVCAVAAAYMASRSAANPQAALVYTSQLTGADTDTLASMTTGLLGALLGFEWFDRLALNVQDGGLLRQLSLDLVFAHDRARSETRDVHLKKVDSRVLDNLVHTLEEGEVQVALPTQLKASVQNVVRLIAAQGEVRGYVLKSEDDQTLLIKGQSIVSHVDTHGGATLASLELPVKSLASLRTLFEEVLKIRPLLVSEYRVAYKGVAFYRAQERGYAGTPVSLLLTVPDVRDVRSRSIKCELPYYELPEDGAESKRLSYAVDPGVTVVVSEVS